MKSFLLFLASFLSIGLSQRANDEVLVLEFPKPVCVAGGPFLSEGSGELSQGDFISTRGSTFAPVCPTIIQNGVTFLDASNGFTSEATASAALISEASIADDVLVGDTSWEFFLFFDDENDIDLTKEFVLLEISRNTQSASSWTLGTDFFFRISMVFAGNNDLVTVRVNNEAAQARLDPENQLRTAAGTLFHLVVTIDVSSGTVVAFSNGVENQIPGGLNNQNAQNEAGVIDITNAPQAQHIVLGTSFQTLVPGENTVVRMPVDMHLFAVYDRLLSAVEVGNNRDASVSDSLPAAADFNLDHIEDSVTVLDFSTAVFDFDQDILGSATENIQVRISADVDDSIGALSVSVPATVTLADIVQYTQKQENEDKLVDSFEFFAFQNNNLAQKSEGDNVYTLTYQESNDDPQALDAQFVVAELQRAEIQLTAGDEDDTGNGRTELTFRPSQFTILDIQISEINVDGLDTPVASVIKCFDDNQPLHIGDVLDQNIETSADELRFTKTVCVDANAFDNQVDAFLGSVTITYSVQDSAGGDSTNLPANEAEFQTGQAVIDVVQALSSGCQFLDPSLCEDVFTESVVTNGNRVSIKLQGFDSRCQGENLITPDGNCNTRNANRRIVIRQPLPDPTTEGTLFFTNAANNQVAITDSDFDENGRFILTEVLPNNDATLSFDLVFEAVAGYFNLSPFPICLDNSQLGTAGFEERSQCLDPNAFNGANEPIIETCIGDFCDEDGNGFQHTTGPFLINEIEPFNPTQPFGFCNGLDVVKNGCPLRINTQLTLGGGAFSEDSVETSHVIWVKNELSDQSEYELTPSADEVNFFLNIGQKTKFDPPFFIIDEELNSRSNRIAFNINNGASLFIDNFQDFTSSSEERATFFDIDSRYQSGINIDVNDQSPEFPTGSIVGLTERINTFIANLEATIVDEAGTTLTVTIANPFRTSFAGQERFVYQIGGLVRDDDENKSFFQELIDRPYTIAGVIVFCCICCFCCYKCFENDTCHCVFAGQRIKLVITKTAEGIGIKKTRVKGSLEDDVEYGRKKKSKKKYRNGLSQEPDEPKRRGKAKYKVPQSYRTDQSSVPSKRGLENQKKNMKKKPAKSYRTQRSNSDDSDSHRKPKRAKRTVAPPKGRPPKRQDT